ncbi:MAG: dipeptide epimerase [Sediminibacterium sp.]|nr:dipeptide epimerase [Sediminibacterium sp.]
MKINKIVAYIKHIPLKKAYTIAYNTYQHVDIVFVQIELENGMIGYGTSSPSADVVGETSEQSLTNLQSDFIQQFVHRDIRNFKQIIFETQHHFINMPGTIAAIDIALHDAFGKYIGISIAQFYGQKMNGLPTSITIGIKNIAAAIKEAAEYVQLGFKIFKIKMGTNVEEDIERIKKLYEIYGNSIKLRVDANQGYSIAQLKYFMDATKNVPIELIEQPLKVGNEFELSQINLEDRKYIAGDESIKNAQNALTFAGQHLYGIYNIKLMKCGGIIGAYNIAHIAQLANIQLFWGCNDESMISIMAALQIAYSCTNTQYLDLDGSFDLAEDIVLTGFELKNGCLFINNLPGLGLKINNF